MLEKLEDKFMEERLQLEKALRATGGVAFPTGGGRCSTAAALRVTKKKAMKVVIYHGLMGFYSDSMGY